MLQVRPPQPPAFVFVIDVSARSVQSGLIKEVCSAVLSLLDKLPGGQRTQVCVCVCVCVCLVCVCVCVCVVCVCARACIQMYMWSVGARAGGEAAVKHRAAATTRSIELLSPLEASKHRAGGDGRQHTSGW